MIPLNRISSVVVNYSTDFNLIEERKTFEIDGIEAWKSAEINLGIINQ